MRKSTSKSVILNQQFLIGPLRTNSEFRTPDAPTKAKNNFQKLKLRLEALQNNSNLTPRIKKSSESHLKQTVNHKQSLKREHILDVSSLSSSSFESEDDSPQVVANQRIVVKPLFVDSSPPGSYNAIPKVHNSIEAGERTQLNFLRSLDHNAESKDLEEYFEGGQLSINLQSNDLMTFLRYEHEAQELIRRQQLYFKQKEMNDELEQENILAMSVQRLQEEQINLEQKHIIEQMLIREDQRRTTVSKLKHRKIDNIAQTFIADKPRQQNAPKSYFIQRKQ